MKLSYLRKILKSEKFDTDRPKDLGLEAIIFFLIPPPPFPTLTSFLNITPFYNKFQIS